LIAAVPTFADISASVVNGTITEIVRPTIHPKKR
jgi:hypothetical protein